MNRVVKIFGFDDGQYWPKDFFLGNTRMGVYIGDDGWLDEVARALMSTASDDAPLVLADFDVLGDFLMSVFVDDWSHIGGWLGDIAHRQLFGFLDNLLQDGIVDRFDNDSTRTSRAFLTLEAEG